MTQRLRGCARRPSAGAPDDHVERRAADRLGHGRLAIRRAARGTLFRAALLEAVADTRRARLSSWSRCTRRRRPRRRSQVLRLLSRPMAMCRPIGSCPGKKRRTSARYDRYLSALVVAVRDVTPAQPGSSRSCGNTGRDGVEVAPSPASRSGRAVDADVLRPGAVAAAERRIHGNGAAATPGSLRMRSSSSS